MAVRFVPAVYPLAAAVSLIQAGSRSRDLLHLASFYLRRTRQAAWLVERSPRGGHHRYRTMANRRQVSAAVALQCHWAYVFELVAPGLQATMTIIRRHIHVAYSIRTLLLVHLPCLLEKADEVKIASCHDCSPLTQYSYSHRQNLQFSGSLQNSKDRNASQSSEADRKAEAIGILHQANDKVWQ